MNEPPERVREARTAAERLAYELAYSWYPALRRWQDGRELSHWDRQMLDKHRKTKKGRRAIPGWLNPVPSTEPDTIPFSGTFPSFRRSEGIPEAYGPHTDEP